MRNLSRALALAAAFAVLSPSRGLAADAEGTDKGSALGQGKAMQTSPALRTSPVAGEIAPAPPSPETIGVEASSQPGCTICLGGGASVSWSGNTGSFHVDAIQNYRSSGYSGPLDLMVVLTSAQPVFGQTITWLTFSNSMTFNPLQAGYQYAPVNSGSIPFRGSSIPAGQYFQLLLLRENVSGTYFYTDYIQFSKKVTCTGTGCSTVTAPSCTEDAYTMCLFGGRYQVTGRWKNQYAGGAQANLQKARLTDVTGAFWIQDANTYEFMVRISTATDNGRAWVAILTFTDVEFWVAITDTVNGQTKEYHSDPGNRTLIFDPTFFVYP